MRVNIYAEEMTDRIEIIGKEIDGRVYTGLRFYLYLPVTIFKCPADLESATGLFDPSGPIDPLVCAGCGAMKDEHTPEQVEGAFEHRPGDDDSAAVTFWGKRDLRKVLRQALKMLDEHYADNPVGAEA